MIKETELRISNIVQIGETERLLIKVFNIKEDGINERFIHDEDYIESDPHREIYAFKDIYPVELTPKILNMCGGEQTNGSAFLSIDLKHNIGQLYINPNNGIVWYRHHRHNGTMNPCPNGIKYLHQLQNLIYALSSEELIIDIKSLKESSLYDNLSA